MIIRIEPGGKSFAGLGQYLMHDPKAQTSERVAWTHTVNLTHDHIPSAIDEMYRTYLDAELMKEEAGVRRGGRDLENPVKHISLDWHPDDCPSKEHMIESAEAFLKHMGWEEHQAVIVAHNDKPHEHLHIELNAIHPQTGLKLDDGLEKCRAQEWGAQYERSQEQIRCEQRFKPHAEREDAPTRPAWEIMKEGERQHAAAEQVLRDRDEARSGAEAGDNDPWRLLKAQQRAEREAFFDGGKEAYKEARDAAFREVREAFRADWREFYAAKRDGLDVELLIEVKAALIEQQREALTERRDEMCVELRSQRDLNYEALLGTQQAERAEFTARLAGGEDGLELLAQMQTAREVGAAANQNDPVLRDFAVFAEERTGLEADFRQAAIEIGERGATAGLNEGDDASWEGGVGQSRAENPRVRDGFDIGTNLGAAAIGGALTLGERLFGGFLDDAPWATARNSEAPAEPAENRGNPFREAAGAARRQAELDEEAARRDQWWEERRARARD